MRRIIVTTLFLSAFCSLLLAQANIRLKARSASDLYAEQRRVVGSWCRQDFEGLRLNPATWDRFKTVSTFKENPDFTSIVIVSRFEVQPRDEASWDMDVNYFTLGRYQRGAGYTADSGTQTVTFQTKDIDGNILIVDLDPASPHVSKKAAIEWMKSELEKTTSDVEKFHLRDALKVLDPAPVTSSDPAK